MLLGHLPDFLRLFTASAQSGYPITSEIKKVISTRKPKYTTGGLNEVEAQKNTTGNEAIHPTIML